jgi:DNA-binding transcriptional regulator YhcF (GntR family)
MRFAIDVSSPETAYRQIVREVQQAIRAGGLAPGAALPTIRQLAAELGINPNTVARAYRMLESAHMIRTAGRKGSFVSADAAAELARCSQREAAYLLRQLLRQLKAQGLTTAQIDAAYRMALREEENAARI